MSTSVPMQDNAWNGIREVDRPEGWCACDECGGKLLDLPVSGLQHGRKRKYCSSCMQRYNYKVVPGYPDFGSFS